MATHRRRHFLRRRQEEHVRRPTLQEIAPGTASRSLSVMLRWHVQQGRSTIPKSTRPARIAENFDVFDFELASEDHSAIDALGTGVRGGPDPDATALEA